MEKSKVKNVCLSVLKWTLIIAVLAGFCYASVWAGVSAVVFGFCGFLYGYIHKTHKQVQAFLNAFEKHFGDVLEGKVLTITENEEGVASMYVTEPKKKASKK